jgi:alkanesulfonate monooxygenase SsuD/methylene tetrahydromethanopterin reductase-like flavin-dependent oxidoreductase (luciferase family)
VIVGLWRETPFTLQGKYFQVQETKVWPTPVQQPHVPILIAGGGERVTLRQVAQYADVSNFASLAQAGSAFHLEDVVASLRLFIPIVKLLVAPMSPCCGVI